MPSSLATDTNDGTVYWYLGACPVTFSWFCMRDLTCFMSHRNKGQTQQSFTLSRQIDSATIQQRIKSEFQENLLVATGGHVPFESIDVSTISHGPSDGLEFLLIGRVVGSIVRTGDFYLKLSGGTAVHEMHSLYGERSKYTRKTMPPSSKLLTERCCCPRLCEMEQVTCRGVTLKRRGYTSRPMDGLMRSNITAVYPFDILLSATMECSRVGRTAGHVSPTDRHVQCLTHYNSIQCLTHYNCIMPIEWTSLELL